MTLTIHPIAQEKHLEILLFLSGATPPDPINHEYLSNWQMKLYVFIIIGHDVLKYIYIAEGVN
jgi:hypothetical protein